MNDKDFLYTLNSIITDLELLKQIVKELEDKVNKRMNNE